MANLLRLNQVIGRVGISKSTIYARIRKGQFPAPITTVASNISLWVESEIDHWVDAHIEASRLFAAQEPPSYPVPDAENKRTPLWMQQDRELKDREPIPAPAARQDGAPC